MQTSAVDLQVVETGYLSHDEHSPCLVDRYPVLVFRKDFWSREIGESGQDMCVENVCVLFLEGKVFYSRPRSL